MKTKQKYFTYVILSLTIAACTSNRMAEEEPEPLHQKPLSLELSTMGEYMLNPFLGDDKKPVVAETGDTLISVFHIPTEGKRIHPDSVAQPMVLPYRASDIDSTPKIKISQLRNDLTTKRVNHDSLTQIQLQDGATNGIVKYLISSEGDSVKTGVSIELTGHEVEVHRPIIRPALLPRLKDAAHTDLHYVDVDQGLLSSYISCMIQDNSGNIWVGTEGRGASMYDGTSFIHFTEEQGLSGNTIVSILEDRLGNIWLGTYAHGVTKYDGNKFTHFKLSASGNGRSVLTIFEDSKGNMWFGTEECGAIMFNGNNFIYYTENEGLTSNQVNHITEDKTGNIWLATAGGAVKFTGDSFTHFKEKDGLCSNDVNVISEDTRGNLWFGTWGGGVSKYDGYSFTHITEKDGLSGNIIMSIYEDTRGNIWLGSYDGGVTKYDGNSFTSMSSNDGLSSNAILSILDDKSGNIWFGTYGGGLSKYREHSFKHFTVDNGLSSDNILSITEDRFNNLWLGKDANGGVGLYDGELFTDLPSLARISDSITIDGSIMSIIEDSMGNIWWGTHEDGARMYDGNSITQFTEENGLTSNVIMSILEAKSGDIWFATGQGISVYNGKHFTQFTQEVGLSNSVVSSIIEDTYGRLWFGTHGDGVFIYDGSSFFQISGNEGLFSNTILTIYEDNEGGLWFGTWGDGLIYFNGKSFTTIKEEEGLSNNIVWSIIQDKNGTIWFGTESGLTAMSPIEDNNQTANILRIENKQWAISNFGKNDGLKALDFYGRSVCLDHKNQIWWGTGKGLTCLDMNNYALPNNKPRVFLRQIDVNNTFVDYRNESNNLISDINFSQIKEFANYPQNLELPYNLNHLTFHYSSIDWQAPHQLKYSYKIQGLDDDWAPLTKETKVDFRNLDYGRYKFKLRAVGAAGIWSDELDYEFKILPPWWHTWWARICFGILSVIVVYAAFRARVSKLKTRQKKLEYEIAQSIAEIKKQKEAAEESHQKITDSINYAQRIQKAILPTANTFKSSLPESFVLYIPKDIVAGDFYWLEQCGDTVLFAAADCTGHGVPGALISMICYAGLNKSVREHGLTEPGKILDKTREIVIEEFGNSESGVPDGMDIALCSIEGNTLRYAGAFNPLWIVRDGTLLEIKADRQPIGKYVFSRPYHTHEHTLQSGDLIYIFSDGFADQFGGEKDTKFKTKNLKSLLLSMQHKKMDEQRQLIHAAFQEWKGKRDQLDDVCIIGVKIE